MSREAGRPQEPPVESWKAIATYLKRDVRTVIRWEKAEGLPVHRLRHHARSSVFAYPGEIESWKARRELPPETSPRPQCSPPQPLTQGLPFEKLEDDVDDAILGAQVVEGHDVGVLEGGHGPRLALEAPLPVGIQRAVRGKDLESDVTSQASIPSAVDLPHAPRTEGPSIEAVEPL